MREVDLWIYGYLVTSALFDAFLHPANCLECNAKRFISHTLDMPLYTYTYMELHRSWSTNPKYYTIKSHHSPVIVLCRSSSLLQERHDHSTNGVCYLPGFQLIRVDQVHRRHWNLWNFWEKNYGKDVSTNS